MATYNAFAGSIVREHGGQLHAATRPSGAEFVFDLEKAGEATSEGASRV